MTARDTRSRGFRPPGKRALIGLGLGAALTASMLGGAGASSHREAPLIADDPTADNTDLYAYVAPDAPSSVTFLSNWYGFQEPGGGPNYFSFGEDVLHKIYVDNNGDAMPDITYEFKFTTLLNNPDNYLYADGVIDSPDDEDWTIPQEYSVTRVANGTRTVLAEGLRTAPNNVGPNTTPNYPLIANQAIETLPGGGTVFAGQRAEGFYADIAAIFDRLNLRPLGGMPGLDTFAGYNVLSIALQVPMTELVAERARPRDLDDVGAPEGAGVRREQRRHAGQHRTLGPGLPSREPARQRGGRAPQGQGRVQHAATGPGPRRLPDAERPGDRLRRGRHPARHRPHPGQPAHRCRVHRRPDR